MLKKFQSMDSTFLAQVVRQDQREMQFEITEWTVSLLYEWNPSS